MQAPQGFLLLVEAHAVLAEGKAVEREAGEAKPVPAPPHLKVPVSAGGAKTPQLQKQTSRQRAHHLQVPWQVTQQVPGLMGFESLPGVRTLAQERLVLEKMARSCLVLSKATPKDRCQSFQCSLKAQSHILD
jgi:hypothetical protein